MGEIVEVSTLVKQERIRCYTSGDEIKFFGEMDENDKPEFHDISESDLLGMFKGVIKELDDVEELPDALKASLTYEPYNEEYYRLKFSGFPDEVYPILVDADKEANKE
jgi:hypothetical protein